MPAQPCSSLKSRSRWPVLLVVLAVVALTSLAVHARGWLDSRPAAVSTAKSTRAQQEGAPLQAEIITMTPSGFEPLEISRPAGRFILMVDNRSGLEGVVLRLDQEGGARLYEVTSSLEQPDWSQVVDLQPGTYLMTEANHPDWLCRITITAP